MITENYITLLYILSYYDFQFHNKYYFYTEWLSQILLQ